MPLLGIYIRGSSGVLANGNVSVDLSGNTNHVDSNGLGIGSSSVLGGGTNLSTAARWTSGSARS